MRHATLLLLALFTFFGFAAQRPPETSAPAEPNATSAPALSIQGVGLQDTKLAASDLAALPRRTVSVKDKDDAEVKYEGVTVQDLLTKSGMKFGQSMRGARLRDYLLVESGDAYAVVYALPELSDEFSDGVVLIADRANGALITGRDGPLRVIATSDKKHARWVRNVTSLTIQTAPAR